MAWVKLEVCNNASDLIYYVVGTSASSAGLRTSGPQLPRASTSQASRSTQQSTTSSLEARVKVLKSMQPRPTFQKNLSSFFFPLSSPLAPWLFWCAPKPQMPTSSFVSLPSQPVSCSRPPEHLPPDAAWGIHQTGTLRLATRSRSEVVERGIPFLRETTKPAQFFLYKITLWKDKTVIIVCK